MHNKYSTIEQLYQSQRTEVHRAITKKDNKPVILKIRQNKNPIIPDSGLSHEYEITKTLSNIQTVQPIALEQIDHCSILVLADDKLTALNSNIPQKGFKLTDFFKLATNIISALNEIHSQNIIHRNIKPSNIIADKKFQTVKIIDFGIATTISEEQIGFEPPTVLEGDLLYISPEQSGRINKPVDSRSDLYSLGITFYQLLTGRPPFNIDNPTKLIYSHIARTPKPAHKHRQDIPLALSSIIDKLLKKSPTERYQTINGLESDMLFVQSACKKKENITNFKPGQNENNNKITLTGKLYGRKDESQKLINFFKQSSEAAQVVSVTGPAGIGKTALIRELYTPTTIEDGFFLSGKFDQLNRDTAYSALGDALNDLVEQCCDDTIEKWQKIAQLSVGEFGQVLTDIVPRFEKLIGRPQELAPISPQEAKTRRNQIFSNLICDICITGKTIVIFLDDLQWADSATLSLLQNIIEKKINNLFIILSYRDNEISATHPTKLFLENLRTKLIEHTIISLDRLTKENVIEWICDILPSKSNSIEQLAEQIIDKTTGNPFYIKSILQLLIEKHHIKLQANGTPLIDIQAIQELPLSKNMLEHLIQQIQELSTKTVKFITQISILGNQFSIDRIKVFFNNKELDYYEIIQELIRAHLLTKNGNTIHFIHDRVQQAANALLEPDQIIRLHLQAGNNIKQQLEQTNLQENHIEEYIYHYNAASTLITDLKQRQELARLNLLLGKRLKNNAAYQAAEESFAQAIKFLPPAPFKYAYTLAIELFTEYGETLFLNLKYSEGEQQFAKVAQNAKSPLDSTAVYVKQINHHAAHYDITKAMNISIHALSTLGIILPSRFLKLATIKSLLNTKRLLKKISPEDILNFPLTDDPRIQAQMEILSAAAVPAYVGYPEKLPLIIFKMMQLSLTHGNCRTSPFAYMTYAVILCSLGKMSSGYAYGKAAITLMEQLGAKKSFSKIPFLFGIFINNWSAPIQESISYFERSVACGLETGDYEYASYSAMYAMYAAFYFGEEIPSLLKRYPEVHKILAGFNKIHAIYGAKYWHQLLLSLSDPQGDGTTISGEMIDEKEVFPILKEGQDLTTYAVFMIGKLQLYYLAGDYQGAENIRKETIEQLASIRGDMFNVVCHFFAALTAVAYYRNHKQSSTLLRDAKRSLKKLQLWSKNVPENYLHKAQLVAAELSAIKGSHLKTVKLYEKAICNARKANNKPDAAIACECIGRYLEREGLKATGLTYIQHSIALFHSWGAHNKSYRLSKEYNIEIASNNFWPENQTTPAFCQTILTKLNLDALTKTIKSLTKTQSLDSLLETLLEIVLHNSGATRAIYIQIEQEKLSIKAEKQSSKKVTLYKENSPPPSFSGLPTDLLNKYLLGHKTHLSKKTTKEKAENSSLRSILILPLLRHKRVNGLVYLENTLMEDAFRDDHIEFLTLLAGQAEIAIENALAFEALNNEREYSSNIIDISPNLIFGINKSGAITFANPKAIQSTGFSKKELSTKKIYQITQNKKRDPQTEATMTPFTQKKCTNLEMDLLCKNGEKKDITWNSFSTGNNISEIILFGNDITQLKEKESELRQLRNYLANIINAMPSMLIGISLDGTVTLWNKKCEQNSGMPAHEAHGKNISKILPELAKEIDKISKSIESKQILQYRIESLHTTDTLHYENITIYPLTTTGIEGAVVRIDDITEQVKLEEMMIQNEKMLSVGGLAAGMAHEINNPLAGIIQTADVVLNRLVNRFNMPANTKAAEKHGVSIEAIRLFMEDRAVPKMLNDIKKSGERIANIVKNMLSFARKNESKNIAHDIKKLIDKTLELAAADYTLKKNYDFKSIKITKKYPKEIPSILCQGSQIQQVLLNILHNGAQAMQEALTKNPRFIICVQHEKKEKMVCIEITDNGPGMDETTRKRVFEPFYTTKPAGKGTGLGMSVSYFIITENHAGEISVKSQPDKGTTFSIRLPVI